MTDAPSGSPNRAPEAEPANAGRDIAKERAAVEEIVARLSGDERRLRVEVFALRSQRTALEQELAAAGERLASLDAEESAATANLVMSERDLDEVRDGLEAVRQRSRDVEREVSRHREQIATAEERLSALAADVLKIQHKLRRAERDG